MNNKRELKNQIYNEVSGIVKALSNPNRLEIIDFIANGPKSVEDIALQTGNSIANASQHLQVLRKERLVTTSKKGNHVFYGLASMEVYMVWKNLRDLSMSVSPFVEQTLTKLRSEFLYDPPIPFDEIQKRKDVYLLDVRPVDEFERSHIPKAVSIPLDELEDRISEIPKNKLIIAYCRGKFCLIADEAVKLLHSKGFSAKKIEESVFDFKIKPELK